MVISFPQAGIKKWGTDEETFIEIFTTRSFAQLRAMLPEYKKVNGNPSINLRYLFHVITFRLLVSMAISRSIYLTGSKQ